MALSKKKSNKLWIWKALDRDKDRLIGWEFGARDNHTFKRLKKNLDQWDVRLFCSDYFPVYDAAYPAGKHYIGKDQTVCLERNNGRQRHWFARFRRKSIVVSKSLEMLDVTMKLFSYLHVDGGLDQLIDQFHASLL